MDSSWTLDSENSHDCMMTAQGPRTALLLLLLLLVARIIDSLCNQWYYNFPNPCKLHLNHPKRKTPQKMRL
jgi:hypothetical protein